MQRICFAVLLTGLSNLASAEAVYYLDLSAEAGGHIVSFEIAARGSGRFHPVPVKVSPQSPGETVTVAIRNGDHDCLRDLRIGLADGRSVVRHDFDICRLANVQVGESLLLAARP